MLRSLFVWHLTLWTSEKRRNNWLKRNLHPDVDWIALIRKVELKWYCVLNINQLMGYSGLTNKINWRVQVWKRVLSAAFFLVCNFLIIFLGKISEINQLSCFCFRAIIEPNARSRVNIPFRVGKGDDALEKKFVEESNSYGLHGLAGHRLVSYS